MNLRSRLIGGLLLLTALLLTGCAEEEMITPTTIAYFTPGSPAEIGQIATVEASVAPPTPIESTPVPIPVQAPSPTVVALRPAQPATMLPDVIPAGTSEPSAVEAEMTQPTVIALTTVALDPPQPLVIALDVVNLGESRSEAERLETTDLTVIRPDPPPLALTELEVVHPDVDVTPATVGVETGADQAELPLSFQAATITGTLIEASSLTSHPVVNLDDQRLGTLDDLVVNLADGHVLFATLDYGGLLNLNLGSSKIPIPPNALAWDAARERVRLGLSNAELDQIEGFGNRWPQLDNQGWELEALWAWRRVDRPLISETPVTYARTTPETVRRVSVLNGENVRNLADEEVAHIDDLLIELESGLISYLIVTRGGFLGLGRDQFAVPFSAFEVVVLNDSEEAILILDAIPDDFANAPLYTSEVVDLNDPDWPLAVNAYWLPTDAQPETRP
jgi:sporulation protein YlmC with PRC-barrel domain